MERGRKMTENSYKTRCGCIHYFVNIIDKQKITLVFLPGLTADHRLFEKQIEYFEKKQNVFVWDAPSHALSRPFTNNYSLSDMAQWLCEILAKEEIYNPIIIGQSMGGYLAQMYMELYPDKIKGFISIDSAPLQKSYMTAMEIWILERAEPLYKIYPWKALLRAGSRGCAETDYGQKLMRKMMMSYDPDPKEYARLAGFGYRMLAEAIKAELPYHISCPALLICGEKDKAGSAKSYNKKWHQREGLSLKWIKNAGHNSNTDQPDEVNRLIEKFISEIDRKGVPG